jgi:hypothetical protein
MKRTEPKLDYLVKIFDINTKNNSRPSNELIAELIQLIKGMYTKQPVRLSSLNEEDDVYVIHMVNEKLYNMDLLYGMEVIVKTLKSNKTYYDNNTVLCVHIATKRLVRFN